MGTDYSLQLTGVTKVFHPGFFKRKTAVDDLTFAVTKGDVVGLLGPNGSGKSTTIKMILGFLHATAGEIRVGDYVVSDVKSRGLIGYLPESPRFQRFLTPEIVLSYYGKLLRIPSANLKDRIGHYLELVGLSHVRHERVQGFSKGMTQRLAIAQALLNNPAILIFDEPMSGLDPLGRREVRQLMLSIREQYPSTTLFFSTHVLADVEELCSSVLLLRNGKLVEQKSVHELLLPYAEDFEIVVELPEEKARGLMNQTSLVPRRVPGGVSLQIKGSNALTDRINELRAMGGSVLRVQSYRHSLEKALFGSSEKTV